MGFCQTNTKFSCCEHWRRDGGNIRCLHERSKICWLLLSFYPFNVGLEQRKIYKHWAQSSYEWQKGKAVCSTFIIPDDNVDIGPAEEVSDKNPRERHYRSRYLDYLLYTPARKMDGKCNLEFLKLRKMLKSFLKLCALKQCSQNMKRNWRE